MTETFELREEHRQLLAAMHWVDDADIAPRVDGRGPFGSTSRRVTANNAHSVLHGRVPGQELTEDEIDGFHELLRETHTALRVILDTGAAAPGVYVRDDTYGGWRRLDPAGTAEDSIARYAQQLRETDEQLKAAWRRIGELDCALTRVLRAADAAASARR